MTKAYLLSSLFVIATFHYSSLGNAWILSSSTSIHSKPARTICFVQIPDKDQILDVDFEKVVPDSTTTVPYTGQDDKNDNEEDISFLDETKTLLDVSLDADPRWKDTRIPFCRGDEYIDGKLAFMVDLEGVSYGIAVTFDDAVAIVKQTRDKDTDDESDSQIQYIDPDNYENEEDSQELMEIMAQQVTENLSEDLVLRKTPKVLTISGGLSEITDNWESELMNDPVSVEDLLKEDENVEKGIADFYEFMRQELGEEEFQKTMQEEMSDEDREMAKFFDIAMDDFSKLEDMGEENIASNLKDLIDGQQEVIKEAKSFHPDTDGVALKLLGFDFDDKTRSYLLVKLLQPYTLIGRRIMDEDEQGIRFELLTSDEETMVIPKLEALCQEDLDKAGLSLTK